MPLPSLPARLGDALSSDELKKAPKATPPTSIVSTPTATAVETTQPTVAKKATQSAQAPATPIASTPKTAQAAPAAAKRAKKSQAKTKTTRAPSSSESSKLFVLDTNVLLHDANCLFKFEEHHVFIPMMVLEELDKQKKGLSEVARNARQVSRYLEALVEGHDLQQGLDLNQVGHLEAQGKLYFQTRPLAATLPIEIPQGIADNAILHVTYALQQQQPEHTVILVSKDINMRLKARTLGIPTEDYKHDHVLSDSDLLFEGSRELPADFWESQGQQLESWQQNGLSFYKLQGPICAELHVNEFVYSHQHPGLMAQVKQVSPHKAVVASIRDYSHNKNKVWGITARNLEQNFALNLLMNPDCDFVSLLGQAGTGKTLLALASALTQTLETQLYNEIIITRATVPVGEEIGFLPGTEEEKMAPWMGALEDNLEVLQLGNARLAAFSPQSSQAATMELIRSHIKVKSMSFMRGRTFQNKFLIIDEAQNLTSKQMKTLITRAGPGTKIVCMGNIAQIDTPYLTEGSSGLSYVVERFKGWPHAGHVTLQRGERSRLADYANEAL